MAETAALAPLPMLPAPTAMLPVLFTALAALLVEVCVILPTDGIALALAPVSLTLLAENDEAAPVAPIIAEVPTPLSAPEEMMPALVIGPVLVEV